MDRDDALEDLRVIRRMLEQTHRRIDPHLFHFIIWGVVVLCWYPTVNVLELTGKESRVGAVCAIAIGAGVALSSTFGYLAGRRQRLRAANSQLARQIQGVVATFVLSGIMLSGLLPTIQEGAERFIPHLWGFLYAFMVMILGVIYSRQFFVFGIAIFLASIAALAVMRYSGFILGGFMGLGLLIPGIIAERRVARMIRETPDEGP